MHAMSAIESAIVKGDSFLIMIFFPFVLDMSPGIFGFPKVQRNFRNYSIIAWKESKWVIWLFASKYPWL